MIGNASVLHVPPNADEAHCSAHRVLGTEASAVALLAIRADVGTRSTDARSGGLRGAFGLGPSLKVFSLAGLPPCPSRRPAERGTVARPCQPALKRQCGRGRRAAATRPDGHLAGANPPSDGQGSEDRAPRDVKVRHQYIRALATHHPSWFPKASPAR